MPTVKFLKQSTDLDVNEGANLRKEALRAGLELYPGIHKYLNCRGFALCGKCAVAVKAGRENCSPPGFREKLRLLLSYLPIGREPGETRLACQTRVLGDIQVETTPRLKM
ncbi:MAG: iron ABC transporter substrate-binding protein [Acidobacteria bacterium]|nr:MAG: iron ABC transporter substrate-binding protein [Acidobacteriota bacterium]